MQEAGNLALCVLLGGHFLEASRKEHIVEKLLGETTLHCILHDLAALLNGTAR
jgi:hypothetical protein